MQTDADYVRELLAMPDDLDRSIEDQRPFGVAGSNREYVSQLTPTGEEIKVERQGLSKGWPQDYTRERTTDDQLWTHHAFCVL